MQNAARAITVGQRPYEAYTGQRVAGYSPLYGQSTGIMSALQQSGPQSYTPGADYNPTQYNNTQFQNGPQYNAAQFGVIPQYQHDNYQAGTYSGGQNYQGLGAYADTPGAASYTPRNATLREYSQAAVDKYMSPYLNNVVDSQVDYANRQFDRDMAVNRLQAARGGGYGDYGSRVSEAIMRSDHNRNVNDMVASSLQHGYGDAVAAMQSWRDADLQRQGLSQDDRQFGANLNQSDRQFGRTSDMNNAQFAADFGLRQAQELNARNQADRQFGANLDTQNAQFAHEQALAQAQDLNRLRQQQSEFRANYGQKQAMDMNNLNFEQNKFGSQFAADQNQYGYDQAQRAREFAANFGLDARDQFYNQQSGVASSLADEADRQMRYEQAGLDTQYQDFLDSRNWDQNQISWLTSILYGAPGSVQTNYSNIYRNPLAQGLGAAASVAGLSGLFNSGGTG